MISSFQDQPEGHHHLLQPHLHPESRLWRRGAAGSHSFFIIRHPDMPRAAFKLAWDTIRAGQGSLPT